MSTFRRVSPTRVTAIPLRAHPFFAGDLHFLAQRALTSQVSVLVYRSESFWARAARLSGRASWQLETRCDLTTVNVREGEHVERALKRFKRKVEQAGILKEVKKRKTYLKPSVKARLKSRAAASRARKQMKRMAERDG
jgi:small subunit ribosomal protein S21